MGVPVPPGRLARLSELQQQTVEVTRPQFLKTSFRGTGREKVTAEWSLNRSTSEMEGGTFHKRLDGSAVVKRRSVGRKKTSLRETAGLPGSEQELPAAEAVQVSAEWISDTATGAFGQWLVKRPWVNRVTSCEKNDAETRCCVEVTVGQATLRPACDG